MDVKGWVREMLGSRLVSRLGVVGVAGVLIGSLVAGCGSSEDTTSAFPADVAQRIGEIVVPRMDAGLIPGAVVAVSDPKRGEFAEAYGVADIASGRAMDVADHVRIGSVTKTFTGTAVLRAVDEGKLSLDDPLAKFVPDVPNGETITVRDLLSMRGGVWGLEGDPVYGAQFGKEPPATEWRDEDRLRTIVAHPEKAQPPRTKAEYSNSEFYLLGMILEKVYGKPARDILNEVAADHGLRNTTYPADPTMPTPDSKGYTYFDDAPTDVTTRVPPALFGSAGAMVSTITDLADYTRKLGRGDLLKPETFQARTQFADDSLGYGLGMFKVGQWIGHDGAVPGFSTFAAYLPEQDASVAVVVNQLTLPPDLLMINADMIWATIVRDLYPATLPDTGQPTEPNPPLPDLATLNTQLRQALDPTIPANQKTLRVANNNQDPELITKLAEAYAPLSPSTYEINKLTPLDPGSLYATTVWSSTAGKYAVIIPFTAENNTWQLATYWACAQLPQPTTSPACP